MKPRLRWTEGELKKDGPNVYVVWRLACMVLANALRRNADALYVRKIGPAKLAVLYGWGSKIEEEMTPPAKLHTSLVGQMMTFAGPLDVRAGVRAEFEIVRTDGTLLHVKAIVGENEFGLTLTMRIAPPREPDRVLN